MALELKDDHGTQVVTDADLLKGGDPTVTYTIRRLTIDKQREIHKRHTKPATFKRPERADLEAVQDDLFDWCLANWTNVVANGQPIECVWEHKKLLDLARRTAILEVAGMNEIAAAEDAREESFRPTEILR
jgi:hypothetical protein